MTRVPVLPAMLRWARERAGHDVSDLAPRFPQLPRWERGERQPTFKQLEAFAKATHTPFGYMFLSEPPEEPVPIQDFRTIAGREIARPSPDLLDTIYLCQERQNWYRDYARSLGDEPLPFMRSARLTDDVVETADSMRRTLRFSLDERRAFRTRGEALRAFIAQADEAGVMVMCAGIVGSNTHRPLDPEEFRGFALADELAPLVFVNGADTKAAQMFTLAHELAHVWLGETGLSDADMVDSSPHSVERWCNRVAAEFLVPLAVLRQDLPSGDPLEHVDALARRFKVSALVVLCRLRDARRLDQARFEAAFAAERRTLIEIARSRPPGGNFYLTQNVRVSERFSRAVVAGALEGTTLYRDACRLLGFSKPATFERFARSLGYRTDGLSA